MAFRGKRVWHFDIYFEVVSKYCTRFYPNDLTRYIHVAVTSLLILLYYVPDVLSRSPLSRTACNTLLGDEGITFEGSKCLGLQRRLSSIVHRRQHRLLLSIAHSSSDQ